MTMQEMETLVTLLAKAGNTGMFDSFDFCYAISDCLKEHPVQSPTSFLGFYMGSLLTEMTKLGYDLCDLPCMADVVEKREDKYQVDFRDLSISKI